MKKTNVENIKNSVPALVTNIGSYLKNLVSVQSQKDTITNASGTIGFFISLLGKPIIDKYFEGLSKKKLENFGFNTYLKAGFNQAYKSLEKIKPNQNSDIDLIAVGISIEKSILENIEKLEKEPTILVFQPIHHPAASFVKELIIKTFIALQLPNELIKSFQKDYNENIEDAVASEFGDDFESHLNNIEKLRFEKNETQLLLDCINHKKIGFSSTEELKYEETFGSWAELFKAHTLNEEEYQTNYKDLTEYEAGLINAEELIDNYFSVDSESHLEKILFIIADFGKGKSTFLKNYAAQLANTYIETGEGYVPIYFNLRNFANYTSETQFGIIEDYLQTKYAIKINSEYFINKKYCFLIDSLDESCDLSKASIEKVISSIKRIQNIDKTKFRTNKIIITSRPFDESLFNQISSHKPFVKINNDKEIGHYILLYGFKKEQFNDWIYQSLFNIKQNLNIHLSEGVIKNIVSNICNGTKINIYELLLENKTLSVSELRRPIFAYMIYKLLTNNINITKTGKIGIYLSFLNLLSKEAKYIHDPSYKISLLEQFEARNILHLTAALWNYEKQNGKQGTLKKADLIRIIEKGDINESDEKILERHKNGTLNKLQFLSHSYFGEQNSVLHFQHQSFAEILLAEYYIKVIIKYALERNYTLDAVISKLNLGTPTLQTMQFFSEILILIKETVSDDPTIETIEKRKLIFPLLASIAIDVNNPSLFSDHLYYLWFAKGDITKSTYQIPDNLITNWCINSSIIEKIVALCKEIIESDTKLILSKNTSITNLFDNEITLIKNHSYKNSIDVHKLLCLIIGNKLNINNLPFIQSIQQKTIISILREMDSQNYPLLSEQFKGNLFHSEEKNELVLNNLELINYDFSDCEFKNVMFMHCKFNFCDFSRTKFDCVFFYDCTINSYSWKDAVLTNLFFPIKTNFNYQIIPNNLLTKVSNHFHDSKKSKYDTLYVFIEIAKNPFSLKHFITSEKEIIYIINSLGFFFKYGITNSYFTFQDIFENYKFSESFQVNALEIFTNYITNFEGKIVGDTIEDFDLDFLI